MKTSISSSAGPNRRAAALAAASLLLCWAWSSARSATVVAGSVLDAVTASPVAGLSLRLTNGGVLLASTTSDSNGTFRLVFDIANRPVAQNLKLTIHGENYVDTANDVVVTSGHTDRDSYRVALIPKAVAECRRLRDHTVVVGYFRPPVGAPGQLELAARIKDTLDYDVLARFQKVKIALPAQPVFLACEKIVPQSLADYPSLAQVLKADAFLSGYVSPAGIAGSPKVKVEMTIANRFRLQDAPVRASTPNVDLDDPATVRLQSAAQTAIFAALVAGYEQSGQATECVQAANAAEQAIGSLPAALAETRRRCERATPNSGLARGGSP